MKLSIPLSPFQECTRVIASPKWLVNLVNACGIAPFAVTLPQTRITRGNTLPESMLPKKICLALSLDVQQSWPISLTTTTIFIKNTEICLQSLKYRLLTNALVQYIRQLDFCKDKKFEVMLKNDNLKCKYSKSLLYLWTIEGPSFFLCYILEIIESKIFRVINCVWFLIRVGFGK